jgi:uncharacterized membrane protein YphA (DoxX/SURF4 family)
MGLAGIGKRGGMMRNLLLLTPLARHGDIGLFLLRLVTGAFLIYQSHDNVLSAERMVEFEKFLTQAGFMEPQFMAPLSVYAQFVCGILFILGAFTRWAGIVTAINFIVAVWMVHWGQDFPLMWPALVLVFLGILFATVGAGMHSVDARLARRLGAFIP